MEMTAVTNKAVLCSISRTRGEPEAGREEGEGDRQEGREGEREKESKEN